MNGKKPVGQPQTRWLDYIKDLDWNRLGLHRSEMQSALEGREVWRLLSSCCPTTLLEKRVKKKEKNCKNFGKQFLSSFVNIRKNSLDKCTKQTGLND